MVDWTVESTAVESTGLSTGLVDSTVVESTWVDMCFKQKFSVDSTAVDWTVESTVNQLDSILKPTIYGMGYENLRTSVRATARGYPQRVSSGLTWRSPGGGSADTRADGSSLLGIACCVAYLLTSAPMQTA